MKEAQYSEAAAQVLDILNYTKKEDIKKIPQSFIRFLIEISDKKYTPKFNHEIQINGLNIKDQTKELLGFIYVTWWCNENERKKYKDIIHSNALRKKDITDYDINDIFKSRVEKKASINIKTNNVTETSVVKYKEDNLFKKLLNRLISFFTNKNERGKLR